MPGAKVLLTDKGVSVSSALAAPFIQPCIQKSFFAYDDIYDMSQRETEYYKKSNWPASPENSVLSLK